MRTAAFGDDDGVVEAHITHEDELVLHASALNGGLTHFANDCATIGVFLVNGFHFRTHGGNKEVR